nr:helix-turn-helix domain-containing protein [Streptomyces mexicanus]
MDGAAAAGDRGALSRLRVGRGRRVSPPSARRREPGQTSPASRGCPASSVIAKALRINVRSVQRWRQKWKEGGPRALRSAGAGIVCRG